MVPRVPQPGSGGFPGQGWGELPEPCVGGGTGAQFPAFLAGDTEFTHFVPGWGVGRCCCRVSALQQACSCCCLPSLAAFSRCHLSGFLLFSHQTNSFNFISPPDFPAEKHPFCCLAGKQKLGLCRAPEQLQRRKMMMVASSCHQRT